MTTAPHLSINAIGAPIGAVIAGHIFRAFRSMMCGPDAEIERQFVRLVTGEPHPFANFVCMAHPASADTTKLAIAPLIGCGAPAAALFTGPVTGDAAAALADAGFEPHDGMPAMAVDIDRLPPTALPAGYTFARANNPGQRADWSEAFTAGYGLPARVGPAFCAGVGVDARDASTLQYFWILHHGAPVATSALFLDNGVAGIYAVATLAERRGKGLGAFLTAEPLRIASRLGHRVGVLQASADGHPVYRRLGFTDFGALPLFVRMPA